MFRIRFYVEESSVLPKPLLGTVVFRNRARSRSMERLGEVGGAAAGDAPQEPVAVVVPLSKSADTVENDAKNEAKNTDSVVFFSGNPEIDVIKGVLRLFKDNKSEDVALRAGELPVKRSDLVCLLAVPGHYTYDDICRFMRAHLRHALQVRVLRDQRPDRLVVAIKFASQQSSDDFFRETNGARFNEVEPERCKVAFLSSVEFVEPTRAGAAELFQSVNQHEMPTCPVCLERLEESVSGILITLCNHSFHCSCLSQWKGSETSCPVCRYTLRMTPDAHASRCDECDTTDALWICLICGHVGCSRYRRGHASDHFRQTGHIYSLELDSQRVWDYGGDGYVHRLIQNKTDGKVVELPSPMQSTDFREPEKIHKIVTEYNFLLLSQLEAQRAYFEELLQKARSDQGSSDEARRLQKCNAQQSQHISQLKDKLLEVMRENKFLKEMMESDRSRFESLMQKQEAERRATAQQMQDMQEQLRDLMFFVEAQKAVQGQEGLEDGAVVRIKKDAVPPPPMKPGGGKKKKKK